ncbi:MAG: hypothetical protein ACLGQH_12550 [Acidobacteriota bacterium]
MRPDVTDGSDGSETVAKEDKPTPNQRLLDLIRKPAGGGAVGREASAPTPVAPEEAPRATAAEVGDAAVSAMTMSPKPTIPADSPVGEPQAKRLGRPAGPRRGLFSMGKAVSVGVDISQTEIVCVKLRGHDAGFEVLGAEVAVVPEGMEPGSAPFVDLLRRSLTRLCGSGPTPKIWAAAHSARANLQFVTIPKVASRQVDNAVFWTAKKEMGFDETGVVFDFERRGEIAEKGTTRLGAMAYTTPRDAVAILKNDFARAGFPLAGLTLEPFAHQNLFRRHVVAGSTPGAVANLHVGQHWSRLEIFSNGNLMFVRVIKTSMSGMEQAVLEALEARRSEGKPEPNSRPAAPSRPGAPQAPAEEMVLDLDAMGTGDLGLTLEFEPGSAPAALPPEPEPEPTLQRAVPDKPAVEATPGHARELLEAMIKGCLSVDDCHPGHGLMLENVLEMLRPVAARLVRQVEMTLKHYRESLGHDPVVRLTVSGVLGGSALFLGFISESIGLPCAPLDVLAGRALPPNMAGEGKMPAPVYSQALGLALSDTSITPSVFFTYKERAAVRTSRFLEQGALVGLAAILSAMALLSFTAVSKRQGLERDRDALNTQIAAFGSGLDAASLARKSQELRAKVEAMRGYASRNRIIGVWEEALALAPDGVALGTLTAECGPPEKPVAKTTGKPAAKPAQEAKDVNAPVSRLVIEGVISGDARLFDSMLASYVVALEGSPLFEGASVRRSELESLDGGASGLHFVLTLNLSESAS